MDLDVRNQRQLAHATLNTRRDFDPTAKLDQKRVRQQLAVKRQRTTDAKTLLDIRKRESSVVQEQLELGLRHDASLKLLQKVPEEVHVTQFTETQEETIVAGGSPRSPRSPRMCQKPQKQCKTQTSQKPASPGPDARPPKSPTRRPRYVPDMSISVKPSLAKSKYLDATLNQLKLQNEQLQRVQTNREETQRKLELLVEETNMGPDDIEAMMERTRRAVAEIDTRTTKNAERGGRINFKVFHQ